MTKEEKINLIGQKIMLLSNDLDKYKKELDLLKEQLQAFQNSEPLIFPVLSPSIDPILEKEEKISSVRPAVEIVTAQHEPQKPAAKPQSAFNFEAFIGGKLISIIGIVVLVVGLSIGVKYAIDKDLINPLTRIVLAYVAGGILLAIALKLKENYKGFSAVLLSGAMASLYFTTFSAYSMYSLFPQMAAFGIMVIFTAFTVYAATVYSLEVIGVIGLVGAYAVPMLLSDGSGKIQVMFCYMLIINCGILYLSFKKYWQVLNHVAFGFSWLIVGVWVATKYDYTQHFPMVLMLSFLFFIIFYISNMSYKIVKQEKFAVIDIIRLLSNSFIFFAIGYGILNNSYYENLLGLFTLCNALVHLVFSYIVFKNKLLDRKLFYLLIAMVLTFVTIAVPVQLEGNWVTLFWSLEAALLFGIGRYKDVRFYEWLGGIMIMLAMFSLIGDWSNSYYVSYYPELFRFWDPVFNIYLLTSILFTGALASIVYIHFKKPLSDEESVKYKLSLVYSHFFPAILFIFTYLTFSNEISAIFKSAFDRSLIKVPSKEYGDIIEEYNYTLQTFGGLSQSIYCVLFFCIVTFFGIWKWKNYMTRWIIFSLNIFSACVFLLVGLDLLSELRTDYLSQASRYYPVEQWVLILRYGCFAFIAVLLYVTYRLLQTESFRRYKISNIFTGSIIHFIILVILSNELINLDILSGSKDVYSAGNATYKLGFTGLWGIYSFVMIAWGIFKRNRIMRIFAISLFGITLIKLVTFDTWDLSTGYKIIAFLMLGVILLVVAFLYQKFKTLIFGDDAIQPEAEDAEEKELEIL
ncbi:MAG: hypothetical protein K0Q95_2366 [Bacteroidota bacterium]|jgi:uncharacterized membrane protein|nr:hypothetical protein [Bacteroidota bacterium]